MSELPIGIFDSGIGGLTVAREITQVMPHEKIIYFGDTLHLPYGEKSEKKIKNCCLTIVNFLIKKKCKAVIIACNTASSLSINYLKKNIPKKKILLFNVIDPIIEQISKSNIRHNIGVIGTNATIKSNIYPKTIHAFKKNHSIVSLATPLLAPMIELNFYNESIKTKIIESYLKKNTLKNIDTLILGCTHYPLIENEIQKFYKSKIKIISSIKHTAKHVMTVLKEKNIAATKQKKIKHEFFVSDLTESFQESAKLFFNKKIVLKEKNIFNITHTI